MSKLDSPKKRKPSFYRTLVFFAFLIVIAIGYFTTMGIGNMSALGLDAWSLLCPLGYLESLLASKTFVSRALISFIAVVVLVLVVGRAFCSWVCPMPHLQRWIPGYKRKAAKAAKANSIKDEGSVSDSKASEQKLPLLTNGKPHKVSLDSRHGVLLGALASAAIFGFPVFCLICPVGLTFAAVFLIMRLFAFGEATWTVVVVPLVLVLEVVFARKWCSKFCPLGALLSLISSGNKTLRPTIDNKKCVVSSKGKSCFACSKACPEDIDIRRPDQSVRALCDCTKCRECAFACPTKAISYPFLAKKGGDSAQTEAVSIDAGDGDQGVSSAS